MRLFPPISYIIKIRALRRVFSYIYSKSSLSFFKVKVHGLPMLFPSDSTALALVMASNLYERLVTSIFKKLVKPGFTVIDLGAGFGYYTLLAAKLVGNNGRVYAFEPEPIRYKFLLKNVQINAFTNIVKVVNKAVSNKSGKAIFFIRGEMSSLSPLQGYKHQVMVETVSLDDYFGGKEKIDLIKMDIEGSEMRALSGMETLLNYNPNLTLITEFAPNLLEACGDQPEDFVKTLAGYGFKLFVIDEPKSEVRRVNVTDLIMEARKDKHYTINLLCIRRR